MAQTTPSASAALRADANARAGFLFTVFSLIAGASLILFGLEQLVTSPVKHLAYVELTVGGCILLNVGVFRFHRRVTPARTALIVFVIVVLAALLVTGGLGGSGIYWWFMFPLAVFFLAGRREGVWWVAGLFGTAATALVLESLGLAHLPYTFLQIRQLWAVSLVITALVYLYERNREQSERAIAAIGRKLQVILEKLPVGVALANVPSGELAFINTVGVKITGREVTLGTRPDQYSEAYQVVKEDGSLCPTGQLPLVVTLTTGKPDVKSDLFIRHPDGTLVSIRASAAPITDENGKMVSAVVVFEDTTKEREVDRMKSEFVSLASHQLRTPLTGVKWFVDLLLRGAAGPLNDQQADFARQIAVSTSRLMKLVEDLLNVSHIETGRKFNLAPKPTYVVPVIESAQADLVALAGAHNVTIVRSAQFPSQLVLTVDGDKIREVLGNLLSNAVKYSKPGGQVEIGCNETPTEAIISVKDSGVGIPKAQQARIFEKFFRADNVRTKEMDGTGLGLYIAKAITEKHGGRLWFESAENVGTTFFVALPR